MRSMLQSYVLPQPSPTPPALSTRIPEPHRTKILSRVTRVARTVDLCDERRVVGRAELHDLRKRGHESLRELGNRRLAADDKQGNSVSFHSGQLIGLVPDPLVVRDRNQAGVADV